MISQNMLSRLDVLSTAEASASEDDSFLGYSAAVGDLDNDGRTDVAVGMPRGANFKGKVGYTLKKFLIDLNSLQLIPAQFY